MMRHADALDQAVECVVRAGRATPALLQRGLGIGRAEARRLMRDLEWLGIVGRGDAVLVSPEDWAQALAEQPRSASSRCA